MSSLLELRRQRRHILANERDSVRLLSAMHTDLYGLHFCPLDPRVESAGSPQSLPMTSELVRADEWRLTLSRPLATPDRRGVGYEATGVATREAVRMALGQLLDYSRHVPGDPSLGCPASRGTFR
jgi:hypothetical protein